MAPARHVRNAPSSMIRAIEAFMVAPLVPSFLFSFLAVAGHVLRRSTGLSEALGALFFGTIVFSVFSYPCVWILGLPAWFAMSRFRLVSLPAVLVAGTALSLASGLMLFWMLNGNWLWFSWSNVPGIFTTFACVGAATALAFWWIALRPPKAMPPDNPSGEDASFS